MARRLLVSPAGRAVGALLSAVILLNAIGLALPLTAIGLLIVRDVGFEGHPELLPLQALNVYYAVKFAPSFMVALFGMLSDSVDLRRGTSPSRQARRGPWMVLGFCGAGLSLVLFALNLVRRPWQLYAAGVPGAFCAELAITSVEGALVQRGIAAGEAAMAASTKQDVPASAATSLAPPLIIVWGDGTDGHAASAGDLSSGSATRQRGAGSGGGGGGGGRGGGGRGSFGLGVGGASISPEALDASTASQSVRSAVAAVDYQLRGLGSLCGFLLSAALPPTAAIWLAVGCYAAAAGLALWHGRTGSHSAHGTDDGAMVRRPSAPRGTTAEAPPNTAPPAPCRASPCGTAVGSDMGDMATGGSPSVLGTEGREAAAEAALAVERGAVVARPDAPPASPMPRPTLHPPPADPTIRCRSRRPTLASPAALARLLWRRWGGLTTLGCALVVFIYQTPPTAEDTFDAYLYSSALDLPPRLLAVNSGLNLGVGMVLAAALYERLAPPPVPAFCAGAVARALAEAGRLLVLLPQAQNSPSQHSPSQHGPSQYSPAQNSPAQNSPAGPTRPATWALLSQTVLTSLGTGFGFLPVLALASLAAPPEAEAAAFALIISAQTAGTLVAAAGAAGLSVAMGVGEAGPPVSTPSTPVAHGVGSGALASHAGTPDGILAAGLGAPAVSSGDSAVARSWERLPEFILACACSKLLALLLALPLLLWLRPRLRQAQLRSPPSTAQATGAVAGAAAPATGRSASGGEAPRTGEGIRAPLLQATVEGGTLPCLVPGRTRAEEQRRLAAGLGQAAMHESDDLQLIETMLHTHEEGFFLLDGHLRRLRHSAQALGFTCPDEHVTRRFLDGESRTWPRSDASRVRLLLGRGGALHLERASMPGVSAHPPVSMAGRVGTGLPVRLDHLATASTQLTLRHKTTRREVYAAARERAGVAGDGTVFDVLMHNERLELTESSIANVALQTGDGTWVTPPSDCGLLPGVMRAELLDRRQLREQTVTLPQLRQAVREGRRVCCMNSVRGVYDVNVMFGPAEQASATPCGIL